VQNLLAVGIVIDVCKYAVLLFPAASYGSWDFTGCWVAGSIYALAFSSENGGSISGVSYTGGLLTEPDNVVTGDTMSAAILLRGGVSNDHHGEWPLRQRRREGGNTCRMSRLRTVHTAAAIPVQRRVTAKRHDADHGCWQRPAAADVTGCDCRVTPTAAPAARPRAVSRRGWRDGRALGALGWRDASDAWDQVAVGVLLKLPALSRRGTPTRRLQSRNPG
jgi:hypothetical protein